jgi:hypothetical protein
VEADIVDRLASAFDGVEHDDLQTRIGSLGRHARAGESAGDVDGLLSSWLANFDRRQASFKNADAAIADLASWLGVRKGTGTGARSALDWFFEHYAAVLTVLGALATAFYGLAYATFYGAVDVSPEQVGVTPTEILTRSTVGGVAFVVIVGLVIAIYFAPYVPVIAGLDVVEGHASLWDVAKIVGLALFSCTVLLLFEWKLATLSLQGVAATVAFTVVFPLAMTARWNRTRGGYIAALRFNSNDFRSLYLASATVALLFLGVLTFAFAEEDGKQAREGIRIGPETIFGIPFLGLKAEPAFLDWRGDEPSGFELPRCVLYLGHSDNTTTVYDAKQSRTMQLPENQVIVTIRQERTSCTAPVNHGRPKIAERSGGMLTCRPGAWTEHPQPHFHYSWIRNGYELDARSARLDRRPYGADQAFRCAVEASTGFGSDVAYSHFFIPRKERLSISVSTNRAVAAP